ncbi:hypothetical protein [Actinoplanes ianthinogenes]|uniref:hypothetical protein n=1 Tax=Actinoplanes ianthinogenes TaxID=122358 RepID=UPI001670FD95|nr:hypothetical protein [Actinoplanes ianthinogenes]
MTEPPRRRACRGRSRWVAFVAVAVVAAVGGAVVARRWPRSTPPPPAPEPPPPAQAAAPAPAPAPAEPAPRLTARRRRALTVVATIAVTAAGIGIMVATGDRPRPADAGDGSLATFSPVVPDRAWLLTPSPTPTAPWTPPPAPVPVPVSTGVAAHDSVVVLHGESGEEMTLEITDYRNPALSTDAGGPPMKPALGHRLVQVTVRVGNVGGVPFISDLEKYAWLLDREGHAYPLDPAKTKARNPIAAHRLDPQTLTARTIVFEVPGEADLNRLRLSRHPGKKNQTQVWRLPLSSTPG